MNDLDREVNAAVLKIRQNFQQAQHRLNLPVTHFHGVPTAHTCTGTEPHYCSACQARAAAL